MYGHQLAVFFHHEMKLRSPRIFPAQYQYQYIPAQKFSQHGSPWGFHRRCVSLLKCMFFRFDFDSLILETNYSHKEAGGGRAPFSIASCCRSVIGNMRHPETLPTASVHRFWLP